MRILALETDVEALKQKFLMEGEQAALVTHRHFFAFLLPFIRWTFIGLPFLIAIVSGAYMEWWDWPVTIAAALLWLIAYAYGVLGAYIRWKFNFIIVTTQKVVLVEQPSLFHQNINPLNYEQISNTRVESQFGGFFHCGIVFINTKTPERGGEYIELPFPSVPHAEDVAAVIEHGLAIFRQQPMRGLAEGRKKELMQKPVVSPENPEPDKLPQQQKMDQVQPLPAPRP